MIKSLDELIKENAPTLSYEELYQANLDRSHTANFLPYFRIITENFWKKTLTPLKPKFKFAFKWKIYQ